MKSSSAASSKSKSAKAKTKKNKQPAAAAAKKNATAVKSVPVTPPVAPPPIELIEKPTPVEKVVAKKPSNIFASFYKCNLILAAVFGLQGLLVVLLSTTKVVPVTSTYLNKDALASEIAGHGVWAHAVRHLFDINIATLVATFLFISAIMHLVVATVYRTRYEAGLQQRVNRARWIGFGLSASTMLVTIAAISGITELSTLILIFVAGLLTNLLGLAVENYSQKNQGQPSRLAYALGCFSGLAPWVVIGLTLWSSCMYGDGALPAYIYWIFGTMFVLFGGFAANLYMQYRATGKWASRYYAECVFMVLSLVAQTALAWQIFAGTLRP